VGRRPATRNSAARILCFALLETALLPRNDSQAMPAFLAKKTAGFGARLLLHDEEMIASGANRSEKSSKRPRAFKTGKSVRTPAHYLEHRGPQIQMLRSQFSATAGPCISSALWTEAIRWPSASITGQAVFDTSKSHARIAATRFKTSGLPPEQVMGVATVLFSVLIRFSL